jgi:hypothetical protein
MMTMMIEDDRNEGYKARLQRSRVHMKRAIRSRKGCDVGELI